MKSLLILFLIAFSTFASTRYDDLNLLWSIWKSAHNKQYATSPEDEARYAIFLDNYDKITTFNSKSTSVRLSLNKFADMTSQEFKQVYSGCARFEDNVNLIEANTLPFEISDYPTFFDWRTKGAVTEVKDQGQCGSCWTFSATGALEGFYFINNGTLLHFSEQQIVDCASDCYGCSGGYAYLALQYSANAGLEQESEYPYQGQNGDCKYNQEEAITTNNGYAFVTNYNVDALKTAISATPVSVLIEADDEIFQFYTSGTIVPDDECGSSLDHAVLAVGYQPGSFIVKNSWGVDWGEEGYAMISDDGNANGGAGVCGILSQPVVPN